MKTHYDRFEGENYVISIGDCYIIGIVDLFGL